jgi:enoyl-CoA hydratase
MGEVMVELDGPVAIVTIDRPERRNAVDWKTAEALIEAFAGFDSDENLSVAVLTGAGGTFCAGFDLKALSEGDSNRLAPDGDGPMGPTRMQLSKPVIAAVEGYAVAGGLELALWCDLRVAARDATLGIFNRRFGVPLVDLGTVRLPRIVGHARALDLILTGRAVGAEEAERIGLVNRVVEPGTALGYSVDLAGQLATFPQRAMRNDRLSVLEQWALTWDEATANEFRRGLDTIASGEAVAGAERFASGEGRHGEGS